MKAAYIEKPGPADSIIYGELPRPNLNEREALVRVRAVTVNHVDIYIRSGVFPVAMPLPFIIGRDMVGEVVAVGPAVQKVNTGDYVWSNCLGIEGQQGTFAEYLAVPEDRLYQLPAGLEPHEVVAVLHAALTAVTGLFTKAKLLAGDTVFIQGGSGSVGLAVLQIAKACGARVAATAGDEEKAAWCRQMGADLVINYHTESIEEAMRDFAPEGIDIFFESTPALNLEQIVPLMANHGRIIVVAGPEQGVVLPVRPFYLGNCSLHGFVVTGTPVDQLQAYARQINAWLARGILKAKIQEIMPLSQAARAHRLQEQGKLNGKIVLVPDE